MVKTLADDVWALGVTAFDAATCRHPFGGLKRLPRLQAHHARWSQAQAYITLAGAGVNVRRRLSLAKERPNLPATLGALVDGCLAVEECVRPSVVDLRRI